MSIFKTYTGNAMLNNALMTIEALAKLKSVSEITPEILLQLYTEKYLSNINKRLKSYTMLFTKNGPLHNDKKNGNRIYDALFKKIINNYERGGDKVCEVSGLRFNSTFDTIYKIALKSIGISEKEIQKKDTNLSRTWFPLIGGLGSDAQALPQATFTVQIHPICIAILQFLPLSSLLYKGGILLIDSSNFHFSKQFIADNQKELTKRIEITKSTESVENVRNFSKGNYILKAIDILNTKEEFEETYSDLNLWSFSNSGTGANCEIERIPNSLIRKLRNLIRSPSIGSQLRNILNTNAVSDRFLEALEANEEWHLLYANTFGSGKKKIKHEGVSVDFLEAYFKETGNSKLTQYAKYIAHLVNKYKSESFEKYLDKTNAWNEKEYRVDLYSVLVLATKHGEWNLYHHQQILDDPLILPIKNTFYKLHKLIHFYYQHKTYSDNLPELKDNTTNTRLVCAWLIALIQRDERRIAIINDLTNKQNYTTVNYSSLFARAYELPELTLLDIKKALYDDDFNLSKNGINELLRIFFNHPEQELYTVKSIELPSTQLEATWLEDLNDFSCDYQAYYFKKYEHPETGAKPFNKFRNLVRRIPMETSDFLYWFHEATEYVNDYLRENKNIIGDKWSNALLYNPNGEYSVSFAKLAIKFSLLKQLQHSLKPNQILIS